MTVDDRRAPVDRDWPVIRKNIGKAPVSRPVRTEITDEGGDVSVVAELIIILAFLSLVLQ